MPTGYDLVKYICAEGLRADKIYLHTDNSVGRDNMYRTLLGAQRRGFIDDNIEILDYEIRIKSIKYKSSLKFIEVLKRHAESIEKADRNFKDIVFGDKLIVSSKELEELYCKDYIKLHLKRRLDKIRERILFLLKPYEKERINEIYEDLWDTGYFVDEREAKEKAITSTREETKHINAGISRITAFDLIDIYKKLFEALDPEIKNYTLKMLETKFLNYEDQVPLLYLKGVFGDLPKTTDIKYVIIDEAQDYTPIQYEIFYQLFNHANITMLGDLNQSINPFMNVGDYKNIAHIFHQDNTCIINLTKSYRSTMEITEFSRKLLGYEVNAEYVERSGDKPTVIGFSDENSINERIIKDIEMYKEKGYKSIGIITRTIKEADRVYSLLKDRTEVKALTKDDDEYINGTLVIPAYLAKGLEFDVVLIYNAGDENYSSEEERLLFYTACTRALHRLNVYYAGRLTPLME